MPSDEPVDLRTKKLLYDEAQANKTDDVDSDDEYLKSFDDVSKPVKQTASSGSSLGHFSDPNALNRQPDMQSSITIPSMAEPSDESNEVTPKRLRSSVGLHKFGKKALH